MPGEKGVEGASVADEDVSVADEGAAVIVKFLPTSFQYGAAAHEAAARAKLAPKVLSMQGSEGERELKIHL